MIVGSVSEFRSRDGLVRGFLTQTRLAGLKIDQKVGMISQFLFRLESGMSDNK
jgi:hypothetical protein